ncbi:MAG: TRIC cation channel family protein [Puniceicoccales bacterium]
MDKSWLRGPLWVLICLGLWGLTMSGRAEEPNKVGWFLWDPYVIQVEEGGIQKLSGLNVELANAVFRRMKLKVDWEEVDWKAFLQQMSDDGRGLAVGASKTTEREEFAWFSDPFFEENIVLIERDGVDLDKNLKSRGALLEEVRSSGLRVGFVEGYYYGADIGNFLEALPENQRVSSRNDSEGLERLLSGEADVMVADRMVATTVAWRLDALDDVEIYPLVLNRSPLHVMFAKGSFDASVRDEFNTALAEMEQDGTIQDIKRRYMLPILLEITLHTDWFVWIGLVGVFAFAISGVLLARKEGYDLFGAFVLSSLPALGGGVVREVLTDRHPILLFRSNLQVYIFIVIGVVIGGTVCFKVYDAIRARRPEGNAFFGERFVKLPMQLVGICDALGLSAFIVTGVMIALEQRCEPLWLWGALIAALTGSGGGILRDVVRADAANPMIKGEFYPEIALFWGLLLSVFLEWQTTRLNLLEIGIAVIVTMVGAFVTRMLVIRYQIRSPLLSASGKRLSAGQRPVARDA